MDEPKKTLRWLARLPEGDTVGVKMPLTQPTKSEARAAVKRSLAKAFGVPVPRLPIGTTLRLI